MGHRILLQLVITTTTKMSMMLDLLLLLMLITKAESQKPWWRGGIATRKVFARPESFCACLQNYP